jgi:predicted lipoprotein
MAFTTMIRFSLSSFALIFVLLYSSSCTKDPNDNELDYSDLFVNLADNIIVPRYSVLQTELLNLEENLNLYSASESSLLLLQNQYIVAYHAWQKVAVFEFGPAAEYSALIAIPSQPILLKLKRILIA